MVNLLETAQCQHGQQMVDMKAVGGRVETAVEDDFVRSTKCLMVVCAMNSCDYRSFNTFIYSSLTILVSIR